MSYEQFVKCIEEELKSSLGEGQTLYVKNVIKNNGRQRRGLVFCMSGVNVSPTIYLEEYYEKYRQGCSLQSVAREILQLYRCVMVTEPWEDPFLSRFEDVKPKIIYQLVNRERNKELLKDIPSVSFLDLAIVFQVMVEMRQERIATMLIRNEHLRWWKTGKDEIYRAACENTQRMLPAEFVSMYTMLTREWGHMAEEPEPDPEESSDSPMYVLTNSIRSYGASAVLYRNVLQHIGSYLKEDFFVIPSSVHEMLIVPESSAPSWKEISMIVKEINHTQVEEEEVLSDLPYHYERSSQTLSLPDWSQTEK